MLPSNTILSFGTTTLASAAGFPNVLVFRCGRWIALYGSFPKRTKRGMSIYLAKYHPRKSTPEGQRASAQLNVPPYVDGSCRREPDHQHRPPHLALTVVARS